MEIYLHLPDYELGSQKVQIAKTHEEGRLFSPVDQLMDAGFLQHFRCLESEKAFDMSCRLLKKMDSKMNAAGFALQDIDGLIYATCLPINANVGDLNTYDSTKDIKHLIEYPASHLQAEFSMEKAFVVGIDQQACTSMLGAIRLARNFLVAEPELNDFLCITSDKFPYDAKFEQSYNLISDGAAAVVVSRKKGGFKYLAAHQITNGAMARANDDETVGHYFNYSRRLILETLEKAGLTIDEIDHIVPQNTNKVAWQILSSVLRTDINRVYMKTLPVIGHVISGDNIINLAQMETDNVIKSGERCLLLMAGFGLNWQCLILEKV